MTDLHKLARIILIGLGIYILAWGVFLAFSFLAYLFAGDSLKWNAVVFSFLNIPFAGLIAYLLFSRADFFAEKVVGEEETTPSTMDWLPFAFRLTSVFAGVLYLHWTVPRIISTIALYVSLKGARSVTCYSRWQPIVTWVIQLGLGIYLVCGAPHFVRWQVKKTVEECKKVGDTEIS